MHLRVLAPPGPPRDVVVEVLDPDATVADLAAALDPARPPGPLQVDDRLLSAATPLDRAGIGDGAVVARPGASATVPAQGPAAVAALTVATGLDAGRELLLVPGAHLLGRSAPAGAPAAADLELDDPTVSTPHARLHVAADGSVAVEDLGSTNGTWVDGAPVPVGVRVAAPASVRCGAAQLVVGPVPRTPASGPGGPAGGSATRPWHRTRRAPAPAPPPPLDAPTPPDPPAPPAPVGPVALVGSVAVAGALVLALGSWRHAAFALLGPVVVVANAVDARRRRARGRRRDRRRRTADLAALDDALGERCRVELADRRSRYAGPALAVARARRHAPGCWERRPGDADAFQVAIGVGPAAWDPPVRSSDARWPDDLATTVDPHRILAEAPLGLTLTPGCPIAVVGPPRAAAALVRSIVVQAATAHGPADLGVAVLAGPEEAAGWDWAAWLPHTREPAAGSLLAGHPSAADAVADALVRADPGPAVGPAPPGAGGPARRTLVVLHDPGALAARRSAARTILRAATSPTTGLVAVVLLRSPAAVPAACRVVLHVDAAGRLTAPPEVAAGPAVVAGLGRALAADAARALARHDDPEVDDLGRGLPGEVGLLDLLGPDRATAAGLAARWTAAGDDPPARAVLGVAADGPLVVDLAADGPHALVAGTTGSGKSELLRSLIASLAAGSSPDHLTFVLIDFKGGSAFDACARLPHTTGLVTDLDEHLAGRALRCLEAELRHRERRLRAVGADHLGDLRRRAPTGEPLPRLVVVVDEFATLAAELPGFLPALVGVAQRGRSLGVHLVLATQRPSGAVSEHIRANTALRIALRVEDPAESTDVIDGPDAASLPRRRPGRALVRLGPGDLVAVQAALATGSRGSGAAPGGTGPAGVAVRPLGLAAPPDEHLRGAAPGGVPGRRGSEPVGPDDASATDLDRLVAAAADAWTSLGGRAPRPAWPPPLPAEVPWPAATDEEPADGAGPPRLVLGLADDPDAQRQRPHAWRLDDGPLLVVGLAGSGTTTAAATAVLEAARRWSPSGCHVHVVDLGAGGLTALAGLPHVGAVVGAEDLERQRRLLDELTGELRARRAAGRPDAGRPRRLLVVDGLGALRARWDDPDPDGPWSQLLDLLARGAEVGIHVLLVAEGVGAAPHQVVAACRQRLVLRLAEPGDHAAFGIPAGVVADLVPGRGLSAEDRALVQVARPVDGLAAAVARLAGRALPPAAGDRGPRPVAVLPPRVDLAPLLAGGAPGRPAHGLELVLGLADRGLAVARLVLPPAALALVAGPPGSGRTTALATVARSGRAAGAAVVVVTADLEAWDDAGLEVRHPDDAELARAVGRPGPLLVVVDDADRTADRHPVLSELVGSRRRDRHVVGAARSDRLRSAYHHWARELRADRRGLLLAPDLDLDGDLVGSRLPRRPPFALRPGRGWLAGGRPEGFVQVAVAATPGPEVTAPRSVDPDR